MASHTRSGLNTGPAIPHQGNALQTRLDLRHLRNAHRVNGRDFDGAIGLLFQLRESGL